MRKLREKQPENYIPTHYAKLLRRTFYSLKLKGKLYTFRS